MHFVKLLWNFKLNLFSGSCQKEKIVGGRDASISNFPYQVTLKVNGNHICGGSIISTRHILTAAHCIVGMVRAPYTNFKVVTGTTNSVRGGQFHNVLRVTTHPQYTGDGSNSYKHDVAVITVNLYLYLMYSVHDILNNNIIIDKFDTLAVGTNSIQQRTEGNQSAKHGHSWW